MRTQWLLNVASEASEDVARILYQQGGTTHRVSDDDYQPAVLHLDPQKVKAMRAEEAETVVGFLDTSLLEAVWDKDRRKGVRLAIAARNNLPATLARKALEWGLSEGNFSSQTSSGLIRCLPLQDVVTTLIDMVPYQRRYVREAAGQHIGQLIDNSSQLAELDVLRSSIASEIWYQLAAEVFSYSSVRDAVLQRWPEDADAILQSLETISAPLARAALEDPQLMEIITRNLLGLSVEAYQVIREAIANHQNWAEAMTLMGRDSKTWLTGSIAGYSTEELLSLPKRVLEMLLYAEPTVPSDLVRKVLQQQLIGSRELTLAVAHTQDLELCKDVWKVSDDAYRQSLFNAISTSLGNYPTLREALAGDIDFAVEMIEASNPHQTMPLLRHIGGDRLVATVLMKLGEDLDGPSRNLVSTMLETVPMRDDLLVIVAGRTARSTWFSGSMRTVNPATLATVAEVFRMFPEQCSNLESCARFPALAEVAVELIAEGIPDSQAVTKQLLRSFTLSDAQLDELALTAEGAEMLLTYNDSFGVYRLTRELRERIVKAGHATPRAIAESFLSVLPPSEDEWGMITDEVICAGAGSFIEKLTLDDRRLEVALRHCGASVLAMWTRGHLANGFQEELLTTALETRELDGEEVAQLMLILANTPSGRDRVANQPGVMQNLQATTDRMACTRLVWELLFEQVGNDPACWAQIVALCEDWSGSIKALAQTAKVAAGV